MTLENQIRGLAVVFGIRLPRALTAAFIDKALKASEGVAGLSAAMPGSDCGTDCRDDGGRNDRRGHETYGTSLGSAARPSLMTIPGVGQLTWRIGASEGG